MLSLDEPRRLLGLAQHPHLGNDGPIAPVVRDAMSRFDASEFLGDGSGLMVSSSRLPRCCRWAAVNSSTVCVPSAHAWGLSVWSLFRFRPLSLAACAAFWQFRKHMQITS